MTVNGIVAGSELSRSIISRQLAVLRSVGVVVGERRDNETLYNLANVKMGEVCDLVRTVLIEEMNKKVDVLNGL